MTVVDLNLHRAKLETNPKLYNAETKEFCFTAEYFHDSKKFSFDVWAKSWTSAENKLRSLQQTAVIVGKLVERED